MALRRKSQSPLAEIAELRKAVAAEKQRERELHLEKQAATAEEKRAREALVRALADGREDRKDKAALEAAKSKVAEEWDERIEAARRRVGVAEGEVSRYVSANFKRVAQEKQEHDRAAHERVEAAIDGLLGAIGQLAAEGSGWDPLLHAVGRLPAIDGVPPLHLEKLRRELEAVQAAGVRQPTPRFLLEEPADPVLEAA